MSLFYVNRIRICGVTLLCLCLALTTSAQTGKTITGSIRDKQNNPLPGVSVLINGTTQGATANEKGQYSIANVPEDASLKFSFVGFKTQIVPVAGKTAVNIVLEAELSELNEVVVVGYGSQKKKDITGAISSISEKSLREVPVTSAPQMLQGRAAGVYVVNQGNKPGANVQVRVRGRRSFNAGNDPLYVVDGIPITGGFNDINPNDIESMDVLKDASATAIYGSRGANGVVIVTTKRGKPGTTTVSYNNYLGTARIFKYADVFNGPEFAEYKRESRRAVGQYDDSDPEASDAALFEPVELESIQRGRSTDYQRMMLRNGFTQNHDVNVLGGTDNTRYNLSLNYFNDKGIIPDQDFTRYTTRINVDQTIGKRFKVGLSSLGSYSVRNGEDTNPYNQALIENPLGVPYDAAGNLIFLPTSDGLRSNPLSEIVPNAVINRGKRFRLLSSLYGDAEIIDGLKFRMNFGPDLVQNRKGNFRGRYTNERRLGDPSANTTEDFVLLYTWENILTYKKTFGKHGLDFTGLYSVQTRNFESSNAGVVGLPVESLEYYNLGLTGNPLATTVGSGYEKWSILSYMGRVNYSFDNRFLFTLTGRADGSSKFAPGNKWGFFPSAAVAWNVIDEEFLKDSKVFSNLKLRASYGSTGNEGILPYQTQGLLVRTGYDFDGTPAFGYRPSSIQNRNLKWETTTSANIGLDFGFFNERLSGSLEVYRSSTRDLLLPQLLPITSGFQSILTNVGSTRNSGIEFSLSSQNIVPKVENGFSWSTDFNIFANKEQITSLSRGKVDDVGNARFIGQPQRVYYDFEKIGIWQSYEAEEAAHYNAQVGQIKVADRNNNGVIDPDDRTILGTDMPDFSGGITNRFAYKGFDLGIVAFARVGNMIRSPYHTGSINNLFGRFNNFDVDYWTASNPTNAFPQPNANQEFPLYGSTLQYFDGSFIKIRSINLGYTFSSDVVKSIRAKSLRVYITAQDPFMYSPYVSKYNGLDPEINPDVTDPVPNTPLTRKFLIGLNINF
ncbi:MAG: TonB-dependent receptor [Mucilaginibacter polytrichastri]|nr:TonB-dependent receptor [Mucilaginibacter polytrichastri]